jgi:esterase/lipase
MLNHSPTLVASDSTITYPIQDSSLPFSEYISRCQTIIKQRRSDLDHYPGLSPEQIVMTNSPFEYLPAHSRQGSRIKYGALLIHGLFDCPFSMRDIAFQLQANHILARAILLPGHGTQPNDLLPITYHDWLQAVRYGIDSLRREVEYLFLIGFSTGAALSLYHTLQHQDIAGLILLSPAIQIKTPVNIVLNWHRAVRWISRNQTWVYREKEIDYAKYHSVPFQPVTQIAKLTVAIQSLVKQHTLPCPILMILSAEDETISSQAAIHLFQQLPEQHHHLILYTGHKRIYTDLRITTRHACYSDLHIKNFSHVCLPFAPDNTHYGQNGDYIYASHPTNHHCLYGAYNRIEVAAYNLFYHLGIVKQRRQELTFNPDFEWTVKAIIHFINR